MSWGRKKKEKADKHLFYMLAAERAVDKKDDELARAALERAMTFQQLTESFDQQIADQEVQVEALKAALKKLELKDFGGPRQGRPADRAASPLESGEPGRRRPDHAFGREPYLRTHALEGGA